MELCWLTGHYPVLPIGMLAGLEEMAKTGSEQLGLVGQLSELAWAVVGCSVEGVQGLHLLDMVTSMFSAFSALGPLASSLVLAEMFRLYVAPALRVGEMLVLELEARNRGAGSNWVARAAGLPELAQVGPE